MFGSIGLSALLLVAVMSPNLWDFSAPLMFALGLAIGCLRPLAKAWLVEGPTYLKCRVNTVKHSSITEIILASGMALAGYLGAQVQHVGGNTTYVTLWTAMVIVVPLFVIGLTVAPRYHKLGKSRVGNFADVEDSPGSLEAEAILPILIYGLSITIFKVWIIGVPFIPRQNFETMADQQIIATILGIHPLVFACGYLALIKFGKEVIVSKRDPAMLLLPIVLQAVGTAVAMYIENIYIAGLLILVFGGFAAAPICSLATTCFSL